MDHKVNKIEINLNLKPSASLGKKLVLSLFDYLLHARSQIPFHFELFQKFVETKTIASGTAEQEKTNNNWKTEKQRMLACETYEKICILKEVWKPVVAFFSSL